MSRSDPANFEPGTDEWQAAVGLTTPARAERLESALRRLVAECVNPGDGGPYEDGEWPALDEARAALAGTPGPIETVTEGKMSETTEFTAEKWLDCYGAGCRDTTWLEDCAAELIRQAVEMRKAYIRAVDDYADEVRTNHKLRGELAILTDLHNRELERNCKADALGALVTEDGMSALDDIGAERRRQIEAEGWTPERDDALWNNGELGRAAACYAQHGSGAARALRGDVIPPESWPWSREWWKPKDRRRDLIRAAALIVAEIERLDRASALAGTP